MPYRAAHGVPLPRIEERKNKFVQQGAVNKARLKQCEDDILTQG